MISGSNEQLQQQLEYILLKPDCHSWWISKMQSDTIKLCFKLGKNVTETCGMLQTAFGASCMNWASVFEWHKRFKEGRESVRNDERCGSSKEVNRPYEKSLEPYRMHLVHPPYIYIYIYTYMHIYAYIPIHKYILIYINIGDICCVIVIVIGKWTRWPKFKSWIRLSVFHVVLILLEKVWIQLFSV